jgi:uncharacterized Zn finger protein
MRCEVCGHEEFAMKTVRWRAVDRKTARRFVFCDPCYEPLRDALWIVPGAFTITSRCDSCGAFVRPQDLVESRPGGHGKRDLVSTGLCAECVR